MPVVRTLPGAIYFVRSCGMVKIGRTNGGLRNRVQAVVANCPFGSEYLGAVPVANAHSAEADIHRVLTEEGHHVRYEWFTVPDWLDAWMEGLDRNIPRMERMIADLQDFYRTRYRRGPD